MRYIKLFEAFNESHTDRTAIDDLGNESEVKDAVMSALTGQFPVVGDFSKEVRDLLGGIMFSHENKSVEINNDPLEDIAELLKADIHEVAFTIGEAIWKLDPAIVESAGDVNTLDMTSVQFKAFMDFIESDKMVLNPDDIEFYSEMTGIDDVGKMMDLYNGYGYEHHKYAKSKEIRDKYLEKNGKTWEQVCKEADEE